MVNISEKKTFDCSCSKCQCINKLSKIDPYICENCGSLNVPKNLSSRLLNNKKQFYFKNIDKIGVHNRE